MVSADRLLPYTVLSRIEALRIGSEPENLNDPERGILGRALGECLGAVLDGLPPDRSPELAIGDLNAQRHRAEDFGGAITRVALPPECLFDPLCPSDSIGDIGAAHGALALMLARQALTLPAATALVFAGAEGGSRAAVRLSRA